MESPRCGAIFRWCATVIDCNKANKIVSCKEFLVFFNRCVWSADLYKKTRVAERTDFAHDISDGLNPTAALAWPANPASTTHREALTTEHSIPGARKAAILLTSLGDEASAAILRQLTEQQVHELTREISALGRLSFEERHSVLNEFLSTAADGPAALGGVEYARSLTAALRGYEAQLGTIDERIAEIKKRLGGAAVVQMGPFRVPSAPAATSVRLPVLTEYIKSFEPQ